MPYRRTTLSKFLIEQQRRGMAAIEPGLSSALNDLQTACKLIAVAVSRGALDPLPKPDTALNVQGEEQKPFDLLTNEIMIRTCEWGGQFAAMVSEELAAPYIVPDQYGRGTYLLVFDPLDGSGNSDINMPVGTIFSVLRAPEGIDTPAPEHFLQRGTRQVAAGYALYGPAAMLVLTTGAGVHGFTLDREIGAFTLTHPDMRIPDRTREFAINASNERFWEPPVRRYVEECIEGAAGPRGADFNMRWVGALVAEVHRILLRGGLYIYPRDTRDAKRPGRLRHLYEASPMAMIVEQAGGLASTGRERLLDIEPDDIHQRMPVILGSREEVERLEEYHAAYVRGEPLAFSTPLFNPRSLFRTS